MAKFFLYARKSTDEPDRQILSIEAQITELKEFAAKEQLSVVQTFIESQIAKKTEPRLARPKLVSEGGSDEAKNETRNLNYSTVLASSVLNRDFKG